MKLFRCYTVNYVRVRRIQNLNLSVVIPVVALVVVGLAECALPLRKTCGDVECQGLEYCSQIDHTCQPCKNICDRGSHNFDEDRCVSDCQDYIHDERYLSLENSTLLLLQRVEMEEKYKQLEDDVFILKIIVGVCVAVILLVLAILAAFLVYFWKLLHPSEGPTTPEEKRKKKGSTKSTSSATTVELPTVYNNRYGVTTPTPENSPSSVISSSPADTNITTFTSIVPPSYHDHHQSNHDVAVPVGGGIRRKSEGSTARASPETVTTTLTSNASTLNGKEFNKLNGSPKVFRKPSVSAPIPNHRFRREPSESTLPENCAYDNLSMSPVHQIPYSHHV